ncbi:helix-turn-helix domain-containing protein [Candidatus Woesearchaeota archaeon]|nr:helix-turn-helix domain-containing protein [Candidatus Woesearchaeota archaeon]
MGRKPNFHLTSAQRQRLRSFMAKTNDKREYRAADGLLQRAEGKSADEVARRLGVTIKQVFTWTRKFRASGTDGLHMKKPTGRKTTKADAAKPIIAKIIDEEPQAFGYLKGRWALRDIEKELKKEGIGMHFTSVGRMLGDLGIVLKSPKLRAPGSIRKNYRKREEIRRYKRIAPALFKKNSHRVPGREVDRASSKSRTVLDAPRKNEVYPNAWIHQASELFHHPVLAAQAHCLEHLFPTEKH